MSRCAKFHHAMDENWNFCGMSKTSISYYKHYRETVKKLAGQGLDEDFIFEHFTEGPDRVIGNIKDDETRTKALDYVSACLHRGENVTEGDLRATLKAWGGNGCSLNARSEKLTNVNNKPQSAPEIQKEAQTEKPKPQIDQEQVRRDEIAEAARNQPPVVQGGVSAGEPETAVPWTIDLCKSGKCPDDRRHLVHEPMRGNVCDAAGAPINQLTKCPVVERMKRAAAEGPGTGFVRASGAPDFDPHTGGKIIKPGGIRVVKTPLTQDELRACADDLIERSGFFTKNEVSCIDELIRAGHEGIHSRADFIKVSCNWFLTSAGGE